jgi:hypothetical protein
LELNMKTSNSTEYVMRDRIMKLLSDDEVARVSTAESAATLASGEEYVDLEQLTHGVQRANGTGIPMGHVLTKNAVGEQTWINILKQLQVARPTANP